MNQKLTASIIGMLAASAVTMTACAGTKPASRPVTTAQVSVTASHRPAAGEPDLEEVRRATERFRDIDVALAEGYIRDPANTCETADMLGLPAEAGAMGVHYFRPDLLQITSGPGERISGRGIHMDFLQPSVLIYEPQEDGSLELVAVENLVWTEPWSEAGNTAPPSFHGVPYDLMKDDPATSDIDEGHGFTPHYDRHVWVHRQNPNGVFALFNPRVTCRFHKEGMHHH